ncbi:response regulator [Asticcacaulis sp. EMRT-3]|uniref:response regulator n=1 Tax=Asticcacaulis sp. EMRT-3 TaxID=3040349 RepID=UPI0024AEDA0B|nr:response regulator [Asticcacaulis sp. EMRT-3]MDI7775541.1 response regulator [Asticcacaulis sp. EMRT-3]
MSFAPYDKPVQILIVDDREENLLSLEAVLRRDGLEMLKASSGTEALELLLKHEVALALLDVQMPDMDGFELAETLRGNVRTRQIPIIFLTAGSTDRQRRFRGYETGAVDFLEKPLEPDILRSKVAVFCELYAQRRQIAVQRDNLKAFAEENVRLLKDSRAHAEALKAADQRKDEFLATLAHELRNPLSPIRNGLQILRMAPEGPRAEEVRGMMDRQLTHLVRLIDDLLDVSRVSRGKIDLRRVRMSLQEAIHAAIETSRPLIDANHHHFSYDVPEMPLWVDGDLTRLAQVVSNLLNNAAKYTPEGGDIGLSITPRGGFVDIAVKDNGLGIDADMLPRVFELFTQADRHLDRSQGGLGIGLALVAKLVDMHGGTSRATSEGAGKGSVFTVSLPLARGEGEAVSAAVAVAPESQRPLNVLIVDDNVDSAQTTRWMLDLTGHISTVAHDGHTALDVARQLRPDVILLDIGMPGMDGYEVCRALRTMPETAGKLIIAQTGWGQESDRQKAFDAGFDHHITKPVSLDKLVELLERATF